ncbi:1-deoxy-D-xylulose-5-phosphate reductoisomerase [uncultured Bilophila sp.]|nr:1-deoxy-D-xylulose-5-phosphate reductoisomerase [uncultured Bilophila sp.]
MLQYITALPSPAWEQTFPRSVVLLGSTGSIGVSTLRIIERHPDLFTVTALAGGRNIERLTEQALRWRPPYLGVQTEEGRAALCANLPADYRPEIVAGPQGYAALAALPEASTVLSAQMGAAGLRATWAAARAGKVICLANKESLVLAGAMLRDLCTRSGAVILPVDSEHNAIFQGLQGRDPATVKRIILTASGGPFRGKDRAFLATVTPQQALKHPNWSMGAKITIDSASMMNKGLEVIEAHHLYGLPPERIGVLVHPQSLVHSLVEYADGSLMAQAGTPDMRLPIAYCLEWPLCLDAGVPPLDLAGAGALTFEEPDLLSFPCLDLARRTIGSGTALPVTLNAANEVAVAAFLAGRIGFMDIPDLIARALDACAAPDPVSLEDIEALDHETRLRVGRWIEKV